MKEKLKMLVVMMALVALVFALPVLAEGQEGQETVLLDLTKLAQAIISLAAGIVSLYLVPWLRSKLTNERLSKVKSWVQIAVYAAEKIYGAEKWRPEAGICGGDSPQARNQARHGDT